MRRGLVYAIAGALAVSVLILVVLFGPMLNINVSNTGPAPEVKVSHSSRFTDTIAGGSGDELRASEGETFLIISLTVENRGYSSFDADPRLDMYVVAGTASYNVSLSAQFFLSGSFQPTTIQNGASARGDVVFQVPQGTSSFQPGWRVASGQFKISFVQG